MITGDKRIRIITGYYGSGKTEFALNYVRKLRGYSDKTALADLDIVNVYFRSREMAQLLEAEGIEVISSFLTQDSSDLPAVSDRIIVPVCDKGYEYVIDLGGNDAGTAVLGRIKPLLDVNEVDFMMVVNIFRPDTGTVNEIIAQKEKIEKGAGLNVTALINNTNLIHNTRIEDILEGDRILREVSRNTGVAVRYTTCMKDEIKHWETLIPQVAGELFPMEYHMRKVWM